MAFTYVLFNKPFEVLSQFTAEGSDKDTLKNYIPIPDVYPVGRLDYDSEGLLLLTDDKRFQHEMAHPDFKQEKAYVVQVEGDIDEAAMNQLRLGVVIKGKQTLPAKAKKIAEPSWLWERSKPIRYRKNIPTSWVEIKITQGMNRQVRRMTAAVGYPTLRVVRTAIGKYQLNDLQPGEYITLNQV